MNARQKAKKLKQEVERLRGRKIDIHTVINVDRYRLVPCGSCYTVHCEHDRDDLDHKKRELLYHLADRELFSGLAKYVKHDIIFDDLAGTVRCVASIMLAKRSDE